MLAALALALAAASSTLGTSRGDQTLTIYAPADPTVAGGRPIVLVLSAVLAYLVSHWQQARISQPILNLAETARAVSDRHDYSVRAADGSDTHEIDLLTGAFNHMLTQIQHSDSRLHAQMGRLSLLQQITVAIGERQDLRSIFQVALSSVEENLPIDFLGVEERRLLHHARDVIVDAAVADRGRRRWRAERQLDLILAHA